MDGNTDILHFLHSFYTERLEYASRRSDPAYVTLQDKIKIGPWFVMLGIITRAKLYKDLLRTRFLLYTLRMWINIPWHGINTSLRHKRPSEPSNSAYWQRTVGVRSIKHHTTPFSQVTRDAFRTRLLGRGIMRFHDAGKRQKDIILNSLHSGCPLTSYTLRPR